MRVTIYGVRGSLPTPGAATLRYGGNTVNVAVVLADGTRIFLDAGSGVRTYGKDLLAADDFESPIHFLLSHRHYDHIIGLPFFEPIYRPELHLVIHPVENEVKERRRARAEIFDGIQTPVRLVDLPSRLEFKPPTGPFEEPWKIGSASVQRIRMNHPGGAQGFRIDDADGSSFCYLTDNEINPPGAPRTTPAEQAEFARGSGLLVCDAQYLPTDLPAKRGWGHSTVPEILQLARVADPHTTLLFHHDPDRTDDALDQIGEQAAMFAGEQTSGPILVASEGMRFDVAPDGTVRLDDR